MPAGMPVLGWLFSEAWEAIFGIIMSLVCPTFSDLRSGTRRRGKKYRGTADCHPDTPADKSMVETCPACGAAMILERVLPKFSLLPTTWIFRCLRCGEVLAKLEENSP